MATAKDSRARYQRAKELFSADTLIFEYGVDEEFYLHMKGAANIGIFKNTSTAMVAWVLKQPSEIRDEIILRGLCYALKKCALRHERGSQATLRKSKSAQHSAAKATYAKAKAFDRIITVLDTMYVGNNVLGDCKRPDLLRAATEAHRVAGEWDVKATLYKELAALLPDNKTTVRNAAGRDKIVALLTTTFRETE